MKSKKIMLILITAIFLVSIASASASDANDTLVASEDTNQMDLSSNDEITEDNLKTSEENNTLTQANDAESGSQILGEGEGTYYDLRNEIGSGGDKNLSKSYYRYTGGDTIEITTPGVINGNGAVIDMAGSINMRAFTVSASDVTIRNLTIKNANYNGDGGAVYFDESGDVTNCNFTNNKATGDYAGGGAIFFVNTGAVTNCNFTNNTATYEGGAVYFNMYGTGNVTNCNFTDNKAGKDGGAINMGSGTVSNCNFTNNQATGTNSWGGAIMFLGTGNVTNCNFAGNKAGDYGGAIRMYSGSVENCNFTNNQAYLNGGAVYFLNTGTVTNCNLTGNTATYGGAISMSSGSVTNCNFTANTAGDGGAVYFLNTGEVTNCNFTNNTAGDGGAVYFLNTGTVTNCNFANNTATRYGGAVYFDGTGTVSNCNFTNNTAKMGNAIYINNKCTISDCDFTNNPITKGAIHSVTGDITFSNNIINVDDVVSDKNFTEIQKLIDRANDGDEITINGLYAGFGIPIRITKSLTLNGQNNTTLDAKKLSKILYITANNVIIKNIQFTSGYAEYGGAIYFSSTGTVTNCNFAGNTASGDGGAINMGSGTVSNCNFTDNSAEYSGAIRFNGEGTVSNCNFAGNNATGDGGAVYFWGNGNVTNCNFTDNSATGDGGAIYFRNSGTVTNCNFTDNSAEYGGAIRFNGEGTVTNCNFADNTATYGGGGGAIYFLDQGTVTNCNFTDNKAGKDGGAINMGSGTVANCNFTNNQATGTGNYDGGGAVYFLNNGEVTNCNFADNSAINGKDIYSWLWSTADTCIFKSSDTTFNIGIFPPTLNVDNFTTFYGSGEKLTFNLTTNSGMPVTNGNISISVYLKNNNSWVGNYRCLSDEGWIPDLRVGYYYAIFDTEYAGFQKINRTITVIIPAGKYYVNVTSLATNNKTVNITAKTNIPQNITWESKLLFILPNSTQINANYAGNGTWWAVHTFDDYGVYQVNASYDGLNNVTLNNATISITRADSTITLDDITLNYGESRNVTVATQGATGITADINGINATVINNYTIQIADLAAGNYTLTVTTIPDGDHNPVTRNATVTVNRAKTELTADAIITTYSVSKDLVITLKDSNGNPIGGLNITVDFNGTKNYTTDTSGQVKISTKGLAANIYDVMISFNGTDNYLNSSNTTTVSIYKESSRVDTKPLTTDYNVHRYLVVGLKDNEGNPIRNVDAFIEIHGVTYKCRSDDAGDARLIIRLNPGTYTAKITFGNVNYTGFTQYVTVIVKKLTPKLTAKKKTFKKSKKVKKYTVTLKANSKALAKVKLTLKVKGKTYKAKTNSKGKAVFKIKNLKKKGKYKATVKFAGNTYYNKVTKKVKITVK